MWGTPGHPLLPARAGVGQKLLTQEKAPRPPDTECQHWASGLQAARQVVWNTWGPHRSTPHFQPAPRSPAVLAGGSLGRPLGRRSLGGPLGWGPLGGPLPMGAFAQPLEHGREGRCRLRLGSPTREESRRAARVLEASGRAVARRGPPGKAVSGRPLPAGEQERPAPPRMPAVGRSPLPHNQSGRRGHGPRGGAASGDSHRGLDLLHPHARRECAAITPRWGDSRAGGSAETDTRMQAQAQQRGPGPSSVNQLLRAQRPRYQPGPRQHRPPAQGSALCPRMGQLGVIRPTKLAQGTF